MYGGPGASPAYIYAGLWCGWMESFAAAADVVLEASKLLRH